MFRSFFHLFRLLTIFFILFKEYVFYRGGNINNLSHALIKLGPFFVKLGQTLSTRSDIVGEGVANKLSTLRDKLPPFPTKFAIKIIEQEFGSKLKDLYSEFNETPVAAASISQVYKATTLDGKIVAVKILRPNVEKRFARDIELFMWLAKIINFFHKRSARLKLVSVINTLADTVKWEMDFRIEAASASQLKENCCFDQSTYIPVVYWNLTSKRILTIEWIEGISINDNEALRVAGFDLKVIAANVAVTFFNQAYRDGFFHADMHQGNLFVNSKGQIAMVDFGIMGKLNKQTRIYIAEILHAFLKRDYIRVAEIHYEAGYIINRKLLDDFVLSCRAIGEQIVGLPANKISVAKLLGQLFKMTADFNMEVQPQLLLLQKTTMIVEGVGSGLDSEVNMWQLAEPWIEEWAIDNISIEAKIRDVAKYYLGKLLSKVYKVDDK